MKTTLADHEQQHTDPRVRVRVRVREGNVRVRLLKKGRKMLVWK